MEKTQREEKVRKLKQELSEMQTRFVFKFKGAMGFRHSRMDTLKKHS